MGLSLKGAGLAAVGGFMGRRKEVIDASRKRQAKQEDLATEIDLRTAGRIKAKTTINKAQLDAERKFLKERIFVLAERLKRSKNLPMPVGDIAAELSISITDLTSFRSMNQNIDKGLVNVGKRGLTVSTSTAVPGNIANPATVKAATEFVKNPNDTFLQGIAQAHPGMSKDEARDLLKDMTSETTNQIIYQLASRATMEKSSGQTTIFGNQAQTAAFGKHIGNQLVSEPGFLERVTGFNIGIGGETKLKTSVKMPNKRPSSTIVGADGNSSTGGRPFPQVGEMIQPINPKTGAPFGTPFQYTGKGSDPYNLDDANNWIDPATGRPPTPKQMR